MAEAKFSIDDLMAKVSEETRVTLTSQKVTEILNSVYSAPWLIFQALLAQEINGKLNALVMAPLDTGAMAAARLQGEVAGMRRFWSLLEEIVTTAEEEPEE